MHETGEGWADANKVSLALREVATDFIGVSFHGPSITHIDSIGHVFHKGRMYNDRPAALVSANRGATVGSVMVASDGITSRALLLDIARLKKKARLPSGEAVLPMDLELAERHAGVRVGSGDILIVRTGHSRVRLRLDRPPSRTNPGLHAACLPWIRERDVALLVTDSATDVRPSGYEGDSLSIPIHRVGLVAMGLWLLDNADLERLSAICGRLRRWEFMFSVAPLQWEGATGSPVNPIAIL
jgi:kynurenine formamidase